MLYRMARPIKYADALAVTELDLDQTASLPGRHRRWGFNRSHAFGRSRRDPNRDKARSRRSDSRQAGPPPPREHQTRRNAVPPRDLRHHRAGRQRLLDDPHLIVARPATATHNPIQNLYPHLPTLRLTLKPHASSEAGHRTRRSPPEGYYEFGVKVSVATTLKHSKGGQFVARVRARRVVPMTAIRWLR